MLVSFRWFSLFNADDFKYTKHCPIFCLSCLYHYILVVCYSRYGCHLLLQQECSYNILQLFSRKIKSNRFISSWLKTNNNYIQTNKERKNMPSFMIAIDKSSPNFLCYAYNHREKDWVPNNIRFDDRLDNL